MLTIQNNSLAFGGKFIRNEILEKRINGLSSPSKLNNMYEALKQMDAQQDGKTYKYIEKSEEVDGFEPYIETTAYIINENEEPLHKMILSRNSIYSDGCQDYTAPKSINEFIWEFVEKYYPKNNEKQIRNNIFKILG